MFIISIKKLLLKPISISQPVRRATVSSADLQKSKLWAVILRESGQNLSITREEFSSQKTDTRFKADTVSVLLRDNSTIIREPAFNHAAD